MTKERGGARHQRGERRSKSGKGGGVGGRGIWRGKGEVEGASEEDVVGGVDGEGFKVEGVERVGLGRRRDREERREKQRGKFRKWTNGRRVWLLRTRNFVKDKIC